MICAYVHTFIREIYEWTGRDRDREQRLKMDGWMDGSVDPQTHRQTDRQPGRQAGRQTDSQAGRQADRQTDVTNRDTFLGVP